MEAEKYEAIKDYIKGLPIEFEIKGIETYSLNGITSETIVLEYDKAEFVFVEGKKDVQLGWDIKECNLGEEVIKAFEENYKEGIAYFQMEYDEIIEEYNRQMEEEESEEGRGKLQENLEDDLEYFKEQLGMTMEDYNTQLFTNITEKTSPLRRSDISSMLVERNSRYLNQDLSYEAFSVLRGGLAGEPFTLATEDEWEYLCGGGTRSFFRWGNFLDINALYDNAQLFYKENMFGLHIAYNPYRFELIDSLEFVKGGDGGCSICGGDGAVFVAPCFSSFYREKIPRVYSKVMSKKFYTYRRVLKMDR